MQQNLIDPSIASNISYIMNLLFEVLGIVLIIFMIVTLVKYILKIPIGKLENSTVTHITTNLSALEIENCYGNRVRSRLRQMFNLVAFDKEARDRR